MENLTIDLGAIIASTAAFMTALFGGIKLLMNGSTRPIHQKIDSLKAETTVQFKNISNTLSIVEDTTTRKGVIDSLRATSRGYIYYNKGMNSSTKILIDNQCEKVIELVENMMNEQFTLEMVDQISVKLDEHALNMRYHIIELFGEDFYQNYMVIHGEAVVDYKLAITQLANDKIVNSKYARFKTATETFLHALVGNTIVLAHKWEKDNVTI